MAGRDSVRATASWTTGVARVDRADGAIASLLFYGGDAGAVVVPACFTEAECARWVEGIHAGRADWTADFGGEQFALGRAFYTHYEEGKSEAYFADVAASDARVEAHAPGLQGAMRDLVAKVTGARVVQRRSWCGPGVHVFPPAGPVSKRGGVLHFDTEGLPARHVEARRPALTLVAMLQVPRPKANEHLSIKTERSGGLRVWNVRYEGHDHATEEERRAPSVLIPYETGDLVLIDSYRLHQIQPFDGDRERISATVHAAQIDSGLWECWF
jgi:hypothetical protein